MRTPTLRPCAVLFAAALLMLPGKAMAEKTFPGSTWDTADPAATGWSVRRLSEAREHFVKTGATGLLIVHNGRVVASWGDTEQRQKIASVRKSFLSALYGLAVEKGQIRLDRTLEDLGIDDKPPELAPEEKKATIRDLLKARSGVYHDAAEESPPMKQRRPARGSHAPGTFWYYNNWDFNVLGTILRKTTGEDTFEAVERHIAQPIGMEHFTARDGKYAYERTSEHPAYRMFMSARDLARFGWLFLNHGSWRDRQVISANWVAESTKPWTSNARRGVGYGYLWWVSMNDRHFGTDVGRGAFSARGVGGQYIVVAPARQIVVVSVNDRSEVDRLEGGEFNEMTKRIFAAAPR